MDGDELYIERKRDVHGRFIGREDEIQKLRQCLRDKDKRLTKIENKFHAIYVIVMCLWYGFLIPFSYTLLFDAWVIISTNGHCTFFDFFFDIYKFRSIPYVLSDMNGFFLAVLILILVCLLSIGWIAWFIVKDDMRDEQ
jgi:hypothetical protein